jgi:8-oxo-dGTP diphosphatase
VRNQVDSQRPTLVVGAVIYDTSGKIMIFQRSHHDHGGGLWEFPGGKIETGEDPITALRREVLEELGVECEVEDFISTKDHAYPKMLIRLSLYFVKLKSTNIKLVDHEAMAWVDEVSIKNYSITEADQPFVAEIFNLLRSK